MLLHFIGLKTNYNDGYFYTLYIILPTQWQLYCSEAVFYQKCRIPNGVLSHI